MATAQAGPFKILLECDKGSWEIDVMNLSQTPKLETITATLLRLAQPGIDARTLMQRVRSVHPEATKKEVMQAAFEAVVAVVHYDSEKALALQDFAIKGRGDD